MPTPNNFLHTLFELELDSGTVYASYVGTATPSQFYEGRVISISPINRSIPIECGLYSVGNVEVVLSNHDKYLSHIKANEGWLNRVCRTLTGYPILGISTFEPSFTGVISDVVFESDETVHLTLTDDVLGRLDIPITDVLQKTVPGGYPDAVPENARPELIPWVFGVHAKPDGATTDCGQLPARRTNGTAFIYTAGHGELTVSEVYVYGVLQPGGLGGNYTVTTITLTGGEVVTIIGFTADPRDLTSHSADEIEVTWNGTGVDTGDGNQLKPLYQLKYFLIERCGFEESDFDLTNLATHATAMTERAINGAWSVVDLRLSVVDVVAEFLNSYSTRMYRKRDGTIAFSFLGTDATAVEDFRESHEILDRSFRIQMNPKDNTASRLQLNWDWNYVREFYGRQPDLNSPSEETNLRFSKRRNKSLRYMRTIGDDGAAAIAVGSLYLALMGEGVQFPEFDVLARFFSSLDLGDVVTVTHASGIGASGYAAKRVLVLATSINAEPNVSRLHIRGYAAPEPSVDLSATFNLEGGIEVILEAA